MALCFVPFRCCCCWVFFCCCCCRVDFVTLKITVNYYSCCQILKNSEPSKRPLKGSSNQRHVLHTKKTTESSSAIVCKNNIGQKPRKCEEKEKHENVSNSVVPEDAQDGTGTVKHARPPNASKRKRKNGQPTNESIIKKKKKMMVVEKKPTR